MFFLLIGVIFVGEKRWDNIDRVAASEHAHMMEKSVKSKAVERDHPGLLKKNFPKKKRADLTRFKQEEDHSEEMEIGIEQTEVQEIEEHVDEVEQQIQTTPKQVEQNAPTYNHEPTPEQVESNNEEQDVNNISDEQTNNTENRQEEQTQSEDNHSSEELAPDPNDEQTEQHDQ